MSKQSPEMRLLDDLTGGNIRLVDAEQWFFNGMRSCMLYSVCQLSREGLIRVHVEGIDVPQWQLMSWQRQPFDSVTNREFARAEVSLTLCGVHLWYPPKTGNT